MQAEIIKALTLIEAYSQKYGQHKHSLLYYMLLGFKLLIKIFITMKSLNKIFLLLFLIGLAHTGQILSGDLFVDYANAGSMTKLSFSFMLSNTIYQSDYIQVSMPFPFHASLVPAYPATQGLSLPTGLVLTYQLVDGSSNVLPTVYTGQVLTQTIDSSNYFIRFYDVTKKSFISILQNQWYYVTFEIQDSSALQYQKSNSILQIQMSTVSSVWANAMVYDDNLAFNFFELSSTPSQSITLVASPFDFGTAGGYLLIQKSYSLNLDVNMNLSNYLFNQNIVLKFLIDTQDSFKWSGTCQSVAKTNAPRVAMLSSSLYTCSVDLAQNVINVVLTPAALKLQTNYRFKANIKNPPIVFPSVNIQVRAVKQKSGIILGYGVHTGALSTNPLYVTYQQIFLGWGLRPDALLPFDARVFRGNTATPTYMPYNSLALKFSISQTSSPSVQLKIVIKIPSQNSAFVLQNGLTNNLPAASNKIVKCVVENTDTGSLRQIGCTGVGSLVVGTVYYIGWKMFFPYDNYQASIDCTKFGTLTIYTTQKISAQDNAFFLGRSNQYLQYLKNSPDFYVLGRNASYVTYMKTFLNLNLVVLSEDFQQFLSTPQTIFITNRPLSYANKQFQDVYVIVQNLDFMSYISLFSDIFVAARLKSDTDIVNGYDTHPLIDQTTPKNTLSITTSNSQDWTDFTTNSDPLISSTSATSGFVAGSGLKQLASTQQSLIFGLKAPYSTVTKTASGASTISNNWGMMIMMSPKIVYDNTSPVILSQTTNTLSKSVQTVSTPGSYNSYTIITLRASTPSQIQVTFPISPTKKNFGIYPFTIADFSSIYADSNNFDIMIATVDGIDGPLNKLVPAGYFLINGFSMVDTAISTLNMGFMNYASTTPMDGSKVPTFLRVKGSITGTTNFHSLSIFFDKLTPFFSNAYTGDVYCTSTDGTPFCQYRQGYSNPAVQNYQSMSRFDIQLSTPATSFNIFIPVTFTPAQTDVNFYIGYHTKNPVTNAISFVFVQKFTKTSITQGAPSASGVYGPVVTTALIGSSVASLKLKANSPTAGISVNSANNIGGGFSYFSPFDYIGSSSVTGWQSIGTCYKSYYLYYYTNYAAYIATTSPTFSYSYNKMKGIICPTDTTNTAITSAELTISTGLLPSKWGKSLPGWGAYSQNTGNLLYLKANYMTVTNDLVISTAIGLPAAGPLLTRSVGQFVIPLQASLDGDVQVLIAGNPVGTNIPFLSSASGTCCVYYLGAKMPIGCTHVPSPTQLQFTLRINQEGLLPKGGSFSIVHYGLTTNSSYNTVNIDLTVYSLLTNPSPLATDVIFKKLANTFAWNATAHNSILNLGSFKQWTTNKATVSTFSFSFTLLSKGLYRTNRIRFHLGQFAVDNSASSVSPICKVYNYDPTGAITAFSHDWNAIDSSQGFTSLQIWPDQQLMSSNLTYTIACSNFLSTSSPNPTSISARVVNMSSDLTGQLSSATSISLPVLSSVSTTAQISLTKKFTIPSSVMEMIFTIISPGITTDSILYMNFPSYYRNGLGADIKCYATNQIYCVVTDRQLMIRYIGTYSAGTSFTITVEGVLRNINYNSGTFSFAIDNDDNPSTILTSGTFIDSVSSSASSVQNFPTFPVFSLVQSSDYLREEAVTITANLYLPTTLSSISVGQSLFMIFPPIYFDVLRFVTPTCTLNLLGNTLKNYLSSCSVSGMRLQMPFLDALVLGSTYSLTLTGIINPTNPSSNVKKYSFQISSSSGVSIVAKSFSPDGNYDMPIFKVNPIRKSLNYYTASSGLITNLVSMSNIQSQEVFISPSLSYATSMYQRNAYLTPLSNLYTQPSNIDLTAGANPLPIRFTSLTSGVNYVYFSKSGDGSYYSNLPPLILTTNKNYFTAVSFVQTQFRLPVNVVGTNYTISITLPQSLYPISQVDMNISLSSAVGISLRVNPTVIQFYPTKVVAYINLYINDATLWTVGRTTNLVITPQGSTFASGTTIPLNAVVASSNIPTLTLTTQTTTKKSITFNAKCSQQGRLIYHISRYFTYNQTACSMNISNIQTWSSATSIDGLRVSETYYQCQDQISVVNIVTPNVSQTLLIEGLLASTAYTIQAYCQTQSNINSLLTTNSFSTQSNGGVFNYMSFSFEAILTTSQKIKLVCALALYFNLNYERVSTWDGYYCSQLLNRRLLLQDKKTYQQQQVPVSSVRQLAAASYTTVVYFGINNELITDNSRTLIASQAALTTLKNELNTNVTGLPTLNSYSTNVLSYIGPNDLVSTVFQIELGPNYVFLSGIRLTNNGLIYIIIGDSTIWTRDPLVSEIKKGSGPDGLPPVDYRVLAYRTTDLSSSNMAWTGMGNSNYKMYIMATDDNPFDTANFGTIRSFTISKEVPSWQLMAKASLALMVLLTLVMF